MLARAPECGGAETSRYPWGAGGASRLLLGGEHFPDLSLPLGWDLCHVIGGPWLLLLGPWLHKMWIRLSTLLGRVLGLQRPKGKGWGTYIWELASSFLCCNCCPPCFWVVDAARRPGSSEDKCGVQVGTRHCDSLRGMSSMPSPPSGLRRTGPSSEGPPGAWLFTHGCPGPLSAEGLGAGEVGSRRGWMLPMRLCGGLGSWGEVLGTAGVASVCLVLWGWETGFSHDRTSSFSVQPAWLCPRPSLGAWQECVRVTRL